MTLTLDTVLQYVETYQNQNINNKHINDHDVINNSPIGVYDSYSANTFPHNLGNMFGDFSNHLVRSGTPGIWIYKKQPINISLLFSILYSIKPDFKELVFDKQTLYLENLISKSCSDLSSEKLFTKFNYRSMGLTRKSIINDIRSYSNSLPVIKYMSDYFNINIILINFDDNNIQAIYTENIMNYFKPTIMLVYTQDYYEYLSYKGQTIFTYNDKLLQYLLTTNNQKINAVWLGKKETNFKSFQFDASDLTHLQNNENHNISNDTHSCDKKSCDKKDKAPENSDLTKIQSCNNFSEIIDESLPLEQNDVLLKTEAIDNDISDSEDSETNDTSFNNKKNISSVKMPTSKMLLKDIQNQAKKLGISLKTKNNKLKTKAILIKNIKELIN